MRWVKTQWILDPQILKPIGKMPPAPKLPKVLREVESKWPGMGVNLAFHHGESGEKGVRYVLKWETLVSNARCAELTAVPAAFDAAFV